MDVDTPPVPLPFTIRPARRTILQPGLLPACLGCPLSPSRPRARPGHVALGPHDTMPVPLQPTAAQRSLRLRLQCKCCPASAGKCHNPKCLPTNLQDTRGTRLKPPLHSARASVSHVKCRLTAFEIRFGTKKLSHSTFLTVFDTCNPSKFGG